MHAKTDFANANAINIIRVDIRGTLHSLAITNKGNYIYNCPHVDRVPTVLENSLNFEFSWKTT